MRARFELLGAPVDALSLDEALAAVARAVETRQPIQHGCLNAAKVVRVQREPALREALWSCDLVTADGQPIVWAARLLRLPVAERIAGVDLMHRLLALAEERSWGVYFLGARDDVLGRATAEIRRRHPRLRVAGRHHGYFAPQEERAVAEAIALAAPDLLFVALDTPRKELFLARHRDVLAVPFAMGVGGALDVVAGDRRRAPAWAQRAGLEWTVRLAQEPRRLGRRYLVGNSRFLALVAGAYLRRRRPGPAAG